MEELKLLIEMVGKLPQTALWVLLGFWAYKVIVVGSIYGLIRFGIDKLHSWLIKPKFELVQAKVVLDGHVIDGTMDALLGQIERLKRTTGTYVHAPDVTWLREAIDAKLALEGKAAR